MASTRTPEAEPLLTPAEVATMFRVDPKTVTRWAKAGKLTSIRTLGGHRRYRETEVRALLGGIPSTARERLARHSCSHAALKASTTQLGVGAFWLVRGGGQWLVRGGGRGLSAEAVSGLSGLVGRFRNRDGSPMRWSRRASGYAERSEADVGG